MIRGYNEYRSSRVCYNRHLPYFFFDNFFLFKKKLYCSNFACERERENKSREKKVFKNVKWTRPPQSNVIFEEKWYLALPSAFPLLPNGWARRRTSNTTTPNTITSNSIISNSIISNTISSNKITSNTITT